MVAVEGLGECFEPSGAVAGGGGEAKPGAA
jgi:hypothetical protein